jgi:thioredoxin-dependent peroxiredoxin
MSTAPEVGQPAPDFSAPGSDGQTHSLAQYKGRPLVIYFYPRDNTPGCTQEACDLRDLLPQTAGVAVLGVSKDSLASHTKFITDHGLTFPLLSDTDLTVHKAYGAYGEKKQYGQVRMGVIRSTFLIDAQGRIAQRWLNVRVKGHAAAVMKAAQALIV